MTREAFVKALLERDWSATVTGRSNDVPQPHFTLDKRQREARLSTQDVGYVTSGAAASYTPAGVGWTHEFARSAVVVEYRAATRSVTNGYDDGYHRLFGKRTGADGVAAADDWDGVVGETERVVFDVRKGEAEYRLVGGDTAGSQLVVRDLSDLGGVNYYRADVVVPLEALRVVEKAVAPATFGSFRFGEQRTGEAG